LDDIPKLSGKLIIPLLAVIFFLFVFWASGDPGFAFMIASLSAAASAVFFQIRYSISQFCEAIVRNFSKSGFEKEF
jgi:hypothetical protein